MNLNTFERPPEPVAPKTRFAIISIHDVDKIRLQQFTDVEIRAIRSIIEASWPKRIQASRFLCDGTFEIKLAGRPWLRTDFDDNLTLSRVLVRNLLAYMFCKGWILSLPTCMSGWCMSTWRRDGDTLIFREQPMPPPESEWLAIMFARNHYLRLIGAPPDLIAGIQAALRGRGLNVDQRWQNRNHNSYEFHLRGLQWRFAQPESPSESTTMRAVVAMLLETLESFGWSLYASLQHNVSNSIQTCQDSWYCVRRLDWERGRPVFHR